MRLNMHLLRVFHAVAVEGSFSAAARGLHISQPAVSKAVSELERQLDMTLVERIGGKAAHGMALTDAGTALNAHARAIFALERAAIQDLGQRSGLQQGELVIGASTTIASYWLPRYLQAFSSKWPQIQLKVVVANTQSIADDLFDCRLDLALVEGPVHKEGLAFYPWKEERLVIVGPPEQERTQGPASAVKATNGASSVTPGDASGGMGAKAVWISADELAKRTWLVRETGSGTREVTFECLSGRGMLPRRSMEFGSNEGIARAVALGLGVAMLPYVVVEDLIALGRVAELRPYDMAGFTRTLYRLERRDRPPSPAVHAFLDTLSAPV